MKMLLKTALYGVLCGVALATTLSEEVLAGAVRAPDLSPTARSAPVEPVHYRRTYRRSYGRVYRPPVYDGGPEYGGGYYPYGGGGFYPNGAGGGCAGGGWGGWGGGWCW